MKYAYDIETYPNLFTVTFLNIETNKVKNCFLHYNCESQDSEYNFSIHSVREFMLDLNNTFYGFNNIRFDDPIMKYIFDNLYKLDVMEDPKIREINRYKFINDIYSLADKIVNEDYRVQSKIKFNSIDLMKVSRLFKSLKLTGVNLKSKNILDAPYFFNKNVFEEHIDDVLIYNTNDTDITKDLYYNRLEELKLREDITSDYKVDVLTADRPGIADRLLTDFYEKESGVSSFVFRKWKTYYDTLLMSSVVSNKVKFKSDELKGFLESVMDSEIQDDFRYDINFKGTLYTIAKGGLHSINKNQFYCENEDSVIIDADVSSFYPKIMLNYNISPKHLDSEIFLKILRKVTEERLVSKKLQKDKSLSEELQLKHKTRAEALKIVINSIFGKLGDEYGYLYDMQAMFRVTINGQLFLLMLIEKLELSGIKVFYANTDGITCLVPKNKIELYYDICDKWQKYLNFELEFTNYQKCYLRDVNNYLILYYKDGKILDKTKGDYNWEAYIEPEKKYYHPIVSKVAKEYLISNGELDIMKRLKEEKDIYLFVLAGDVNKKYHVYMTYIDEKDKMRTIRTQRHNRFIVTLNNCGRIYTKRENNKIYTFVVGYELKEVNDINKIEYVKINYEYYYKEVIKLTKMFPVTDNKGKIIPAPGQTFSLF